MKTIALIYPHQLFETNPLWDYQPEKVFLIEEPLFFGDEEFPAQMHQQKLWLHRASMKRHEALLRQQGRDVVYLDYAKAKNACCACIQSALTQESEVRVVVISPVDFLLERRIRQLCEAAGWELLFLPTPGFLNTQELNESYAQGSKKLRMTDFYRRQRIRLDVLVDGEEPIGGSWSFDKENRKKVPRRLLNEIPPQKSLRRDAHDEEARRYVLKHFPKNPGTLDELYYPSSHQDARACLHAFLEKRLCEFGPYEDAIVEGESWLWHSVLSPSLNIGLLTPEEVLRTTLQYAQRHEVPLNSLEGFLRQVIGWREFVRMAYDAKGVAMRTTNHWKHQRPMPDCFYNASTGILPVDDTIRRILKTGYCHHIERLMVLGGMFFLCEIHPDDVYRWFMEMFVDSYDWVMVPNVYSMSQHADGGLITTKPYFSGSAYIRRMSHYKAGPWCETWDGLYWSWIARNSAELAKNPRWSMMCAAARKMNPEQASLHQRNADIFLSQWSADSA
ncbi:MAG: cryptochrome/photolyase family protein [Polyangiaceae bacterium]|nr:cryptochrome/photolyase family protein [Polyangiaceae bacterium]